MATLCPKTFFPAHVCTFHDIVIVWFFFCLFFLFLATCTPLCSRRPSWLAFRSAFSKFFFICPGRFWGVFSSLERECGSAYHLRLMTSYSRDKESSPLIPNSKSCQSCIRHAG